MARGRAPYPPEFRAEAVRMLRTSGLSLHKLSADLGVSIETLRSWKKQAELDQGERSGGLTTEEREELRRLRRENRVLREEREILKKAAAFLLMLKALVADGPLSRKMAVFRPSYPARIRTWTKRTKISCATVTLRGSGLLPA